MGKLKIKLIHGINGALKDQKATVVALGLKKIGSTVVQDNNPMIRGMIFKVKHLVSVEEIQE